DLMALASRQMIAYHQSLDPHADAVFSVSWAGESRSKNWFDTARELTERWIHQQQIRVAVDRPGLMSRELFFPVLDTFMRALPLVFGVLPAPAGALAQFNISGASGGSWFLYRDENSWRLMANRPERGFVTRLFHKTSPGASSPRGSIGSRQSNI